MKWVTRRGVRVNRSATAWLVRRFVDEEAEFAFVGPDEVALHQSAHGAIGFDAPGAVWPHRDAKDRCSFQAIADRYCFGDHALREMGRIVRSADFADASGDTAEGPGLRAICAGFPLVAGDDAETVRSSRFLFDALYASLQARMRAEPE